MNELHLFAGAGGGILGGQLLGHRTVCAVEIEPYPRAVLVARQNDGTFPPFPIWDDVRTFDGRPWRGIVDVVAGGFPCQDISAAGKGAGLSGERSGLWSEFARIIGEVRPRYAFIENSPMLVTRGLDRVLADLAALGYDAEWCCLSAGDCGARHERDRIWILAHSQSNGHRTRGESRDIFKENGGQVGQMRVESTCSSFKPKDMADPLRTGQQGGEGQQHPARQLGLRGRARINEKQGLRISPPNWKTEPELGRVADGVEHRTNRLKAIGNGQVPLCAATAFNILKARFK
jgi:DNA (cytosine-5)-methyltransferase 1